MGRRRAGRDFAGGGGGENLVDESWWNGSGDDGAVAGMFDLKAIEKLFHVGVGAVGANAALGGMKHAQEGGSFFRNSLGIGIGCGEDLGAQMQRAKVARGNDRDRRLGKQERPGAEAGDRANAGGLDAENGESGTGDGHVAIEPAEERGPAEGRGELAGTVENAADHGGVRMIRHGDAVVGENGDADGAAFLRDVVDIEVAVAIDRGGDFLQVGNEAVGVELADEDFGEARFRGRTGGTVAPACRVVDGKGGFVEIALELKAGRIDELLVFGLAGDGRELAGAETANPFEVDIDKAVGAGKQASGFGRGLAEEHDDGGHHAGNHEESDQDGEGASNAHRVG